MRTNCIYKRGFTLLEILVVIGILGIITTVSVVGFSNMYKVSVLRVGGSEVYDALLSARSRTLASENDIVYGVLVSSTTVTRFEGSTYTAGAATNRSYAFEGGVSATGTLITSGTPVVFTRLTGTPSAQGTIYVHNLEGTSTTTVVVHGSGLIAYE